MPTLRVVLDTNVLVSGLAYPASIPGRIVGAWRQGALEVVLSRHIVDELTRVLPRLNHRLNWRPVDFADLADILAIEIDLIEPQPLAGDTVRDAEYSRRRACDPDGLLNPGKAIPTLRRCAEFGALHVHQGKLPFPELERF